MNDYLKNTFQQIKTLYLVPSQPAGTLYKYRAWTSPGLNNYLLPIMLCQVRYPLTYEEYLVSQKSTTMAM